MQLYENIQRQIVKNGSFYRKKNYDLCD